MGLKLESFNEAEHLPIIEAWEAEKEIYRYLSHSRPRYLREKDIEAQSRTLHYLLKLEDDYVGTAWLEEITSEDAKLGIYIADINSRGKGLGEEAVRALLDIAASELKLKSVYLGVRDYNERAVRCYIKCGFKVTKKYEGLTFSDGSKGGAYEMRVNILSEPLRGFINNIKFTGDIERDVYALFSADEYEELRDHIAKVADGAKLIATRYGINEEKAYAAGLLHDIGRLIPDDKRVDLCTRLGIQVLEEERLVPSMLHSKLSRYISSHVFYADEEICDAVECHSTLKANPSPLDMVLFIADKVSWPRSYSAGFIDKMLEGLDISLEHSAMAYIEYVRDNAKILHPRVNEAYEYLRSILDAKA